VQKFSVLFVDVGFELLTLYQPFAAGRLIASSLIESQSMTTDSLQTQEPKRETWDVVANRKWASFIQQFMAPHDTDAIEWTRLDPIIAVLGLLGRELPDENWAFLPGGEGVQIARTSVGWEPGCMQIESKGGDNVLICKPYSLLCVYFPGSPDISYFDLELADLRRLNLMTERQDAIEECRGIVLTEGKSEQLVDYTRLLQGRVVIMCKGSRYIRCGSERDPDVLTREMFRACSEVRAEHGLN